MIPCRVTDVYFSCPYSERVRGREAQTGRSRERVQRIGYVTFLVVVYDE